MEKYMKKLRIGLTGIAAVFVLAIVASMNINAAGPPDQYCDASSWWTGDTTITKGDVAKQTFKPQQNRLSRVILDMNGDGNGTVGLIVSGNGSLYGSTNGGDGFVAEPNGRGDVEFYFDDVELVPGVTYTLLPIYSIGNADLNWYYKDTCYADGAAYLGSVEKTWDFGFETQGFTYTDPTPVPIATPTPTVSEDGTTPTATPTPAPEVSADIAVPVLTYVVKNNLQITDFTSGIDVDGDDIFILNGTATAGSTVIVTLNGETYEAVADSTGAWFMQLAVDELATGEYTLTAQTQVGDKISEATELLTISLTAVESAQVIAAVEDEDSNNWLLYLYIGIGVVVILGGALTYYLIRRKKQAAKNTTKATSVTPSENAEASSEEKPKEETSPTEEKTSTDSKK